jgi:hypothetical protein
MTQTLYVECLFLARIADNIPTVEFELFFKRQNKIFVNENLYQSSLIFMKVLQLSNPQAYLDFT